MDAISPLLEDQEPEAFKIPTVGWIVWGLYTAANVAMLVLRPNSLSAYALGGMTGRVVSMLLFPAALGWLAWRLGRRSVRAGKITFFVVLALLMLGQVAQFSQRAKANAVISDIQKEQSKDRAEQRSAIEQGRPVDSTKTEKLAAQASAQLGTLAQNSSGQERLTAEAGKAYLDELLAAKKRYDLAVAGLHADTLWDLTHFAAGPPPAERRKAAKAFIKANADLIPYQDPGGTALRRILTAHGVSAEEAQKTMNGYIKAAKNRAPMMVKIRECDAQLGQAMLDFIDLAESSVGKWEVSKTSGEIMFGDQAALDRYNEVITRVGTISAAQAGYQKSVITAD